MDQERASEAPNSSTTLTGKKLNAKAPEFVPRSASSTSSPPPPPPLLYARPPSFVPPLLPPYYGFENCYQQDGTPFYGCNVSPVVSREYAADGNKGSSAASPKNGLSDVHQKIVNQVEFYFSDINLATTDQLFRFMSEDPEGYVPLSVVAAFKKVKTAIADSTQLASILRSSNKLLVSEDGKNVKRQHPLTESDMEELQSRIVVAENLPDDHTHQKLMKIFSSVGSVKSIRTCAPQNSNGAPSASKTGKGDKLHFGSKSHAFVEYESVEVAEKAVAELNDESNWRNGLKVRLLHNSAIKSTPSRTKKVGHDAQYSSKKDEAVVLERQGSKENHLVESLQHSDAQNHESQWDDNIRTSIQKKGRNSTGGGGNGKGKGKGQARGRPHHPSNGRIASPSPPVENSEGTDKPNAAKQSSVPRMPDGTKGFSIGRGKPLALKIA